MVKLVSFIFEQGFSVRMICILSTALILISANNLFPISAYKSAKRLYVLASNLNMRDKPSIKGKVIGLIPYGSKIVILRKTNQTYKSEGIKGFWVKIRYRQKSGYVFDGYMSKLPPPPVNCRDLHHYANSKLGKKDKKLRKLFEKGKGKKLCTLSMWCNYRKIIRLY